LRFADVGCGNGDEDSGSKAGSSDGLRVPPVPERDTSGSREACRDDLLGEEYDML
jgi:hypothetical protein